MNVTARLFWHPPIEIDVTVRGQLSLKEDVRTVPTTRGIYVIARKTRVGVMPIYVGLASRSLRQRLKQHLKSKRMLSELVDGRRSKRLFFFAEVTPGDLKFATRYLGAIESGLIRSALKSGGASLNRHLPPDRMIKTGLRCVFTNAGCETAWNDWARKRITSHVGPPRRRRAIRA